MNTILFLGADPTNAARLRLGKESREIREKLQLAAQREFHYEERSAVRPQDISQAMLDINPLIVHFSGHGSGQTGLCFENQNGEIKLVSAEALSALFAQFSDTVRCVVLNACYSDIQAEAISQHIDFVIGMNDTVGDEAAIAFSVGLYQALGAKRSINKAFELGKAQMLLQSINEADIPVLRVRHGVDPNAPFM